MGLILATKRHSGILAIALGLVVSATLVLLNDIFFYESILVPSSSMRPTLLPNERVFLQKRMREPFKRFDVVVIGSRVIGHRIVKRIVGLPGECIELQGSWRVLVNHKSLEYTELNGETGILLEAGRHRIQIVRDSRFDFPTRYALTPLCLKSDEYFVLGDNRLASKDGRSIGPIKLDEIQGKMTRIWYSYDKMNHRLRTERLLETVL